MKTKDILKLISAVGVSELAGVIGSVFTIPAISTWYSTLQKPEFTPPAWIFGPVWTALYFMMGVAAFLVWHKGIERKDVKTGLIVFGLQLILNGAWSYLFFGLHNPFLALVDIIFLWFCILATIFALGKVSRTAAILLIPYILWVSFAAYLNYTLWILNSVALV